VSRAVAQSKGLQPVLDKVVEAATRLSQATNGRLWLFENGLLRAFANYGTREGYEYEKQHPLPIDRTTMVGRTALARETVHIPDIREDPEYAYAGPIHFRSGFHVPILLEDELIGVIGIVREEAGPFGDEYIELARTFADQAAIEIANARLIDAVERQRTELSRFLSPQVAELVSSEEGEKLLAGHRAYITAVFCDLLTNLASRLSTKAGPGQTLISQPVYAAVEEAVEAEPAGELGLKGFARPVRAYEVHGLRT
jgi:GAF domain-containing protein